MKAVLLTAIPEARIVDISHELPAFDLLAAALLVESTLPWFPRETLHLVVVDPGVGTARRGLVLQDLDGRRYLGPDNGLFTPLLRRGARVHSLSLGGVLPPPKSSTFHGRDLFAPAAAYLARGGTPAALGPEVSDAVQLDWKEAERAEDAVQGVTLAADPFGNLVTSILASDLSGAVVVGVEVGGQGARFVRTFGEGAPGELLVLVGSGGRVEVAVREGSAKGRLGAVGGISVRLILGRAAPP